MKHYKLDKTVTEEKFRFYLESSNRFRFPFYDPENPYRKTGIFVELEDILHEAGNKFRSEYGDNFVSINLRGSWLRGIPVENDDIDLLFIVRNIPVSEQKHILEFTRHLLKKRHVIYKVCEGKFEGGVKVEPITFLDLSNIPMILQTFMYGSGVFFDNETSQQRDDFQDTFFGSKRKEKLLPFLKSGILIPYVGWIFGKEKKKEIFNEIGLYLPIPTEKRGPRSEKEVDITKEIIRQTFIARNLIFPSIKIEQIIQLTNDDIYLYKKEALSLYNYLEALEFIHARAVLNYTYTAKIELKFFGKRMISQRVNTFAANYDRLVDYILHVKY